jgi:transcriptional regulator with XRE-family HTH domain
MWRKHSSIIDYIDTFINNVWCYYEGLVNMLKKLDPFCLNVKKVRELRGMSVDDLAIAVGIPPEGITRVEAGKRPTGVHMVAIACALNMTLQALLLPDAEETKCCTIIPKPLQGLEECQFCERVFHPMPRWTLGSTRIFVCGKQECRNKAWEAGFEPRPDLTPKR